ncbi:MAG: tellurite resistance methyltransferase TehB, partial [Pseudomonadota bacterium]
PHSAVVEAITHVSSGDALDLGCGRGRNSILLRAHGFEVTALDHSQQAISRLQEIVSLEAACQGIQAEVYDIATSSIERDYDLIICTVVLQFLPADTIAGIISNMQSHTKLGGLNVIVAPMSTHDVPCPMDWPFTFKEGELRAYYQDWHLIKYQEALGEFHRTDAAGNRLQACFATLIARKQ